MIIVDLKGGIGNQLFQYAAAKVFSIESNRKLLLDVGWFSSQNKRRFQLNKFNVSYEALIGENQKFITKILNSLQYKIGSHVVNSRYLEGGIESRKKVIRMRGYWHNLRFFKNHREYLLKEFTLSEKEQKNYVDVKREIKNSQSVAIHFRRGDFANSPAINRTHGTCSLDYYTEALKLISSKTNSDLRLYIFSNNISWVKNHFSTTYKTRYVSNEHFSDSEELSLMKYSKHNIIANSTFSWWGAWLNNNNHKIVISPKNWFQNHETSKEKIEKIIPPEWVVI